MNPAPMNGHKPKAAVLDKPRARRDAAKVLAVALQTRYRRFLETADDQDANAIATADLAQCMYENIEFVMWALKTVGGMNPPPPEVLRRVTPQRTYSPANDPQFQKPPVPRCPDCEGTHDPDIRCPNHHAGLAPVDLPCTCPPLEAGIIGRDRHMTSCPKFVP
jgi:hypothetical protein